MANEIVTEIRLELDKLRKDLKDAEKEGEKSGKKTGQGLGDGIEAGASKAFGGLKSKLLALGTALAGAFTLKESIAAASVQESAINSLNSAMALSGTYTEAASKSFQVYASSLQQASTAGDEAILKGSSLLITLGKLSGEGLERASKVSVDLAAGLAGQGMSLEGAFNLVAKAASGNVDQLKRYGIDIKATGDKALDFKNALNSLEKQFGGMAALQTGTFAGAMAQSKNAFGDLLESLGDVVIKSPMVIAFIKMMTENFNKAGEAVKNFTLNRDLIGDLARQIGAVGTALVTNIVAPLELAYNIGNTVFSSIVTGFQTMIAGIAQAAAGIVNALAPYSETMRGLQGGINTFADSSAEVMQDAAASTQESMGDLFNFDASAKAQEWVEQMQVFAEQVGPIAQANFAAISQNAADAMKPPMLDGWEFIVNGFNSAFGRVALTGEKFRAQLQGKLNSAFTAFRDGVAGSFASIGAALVKGENAFAAFGKALLGVFGDLAIQVGTFYLLLGLANLFLNPVAAAAEIAGGLALIVLGGALKALAGGGGAAAQSTGSGGSSGGGVASGQAGASPVQDQGQDYQDLQRGEVGTSIQVNVEGNILDRKETGLYIADVINESFGSQGVVFAGAGS